MEFVHGLRHPTLAQGRRGFLALILLGIAIPSPVQATTPRPPVEIQIGNEAELIKTPPQAGPLRVSLVVVRNENVARVTAQVRIIPTTPLVPAKVESKSLPALDREKRSYEWEISPPAKDGAYRVEFNVEGTIDGKEGVLDRQVLIQEVRNGQQQLMRPEQYRRREQERRRELFATALKESPDRPDVRLLSSATVSVPAARAAECQPVSGRPMLIVRPTGPSERILPYVVDHSGKSWGEIDPITVKGRLVYTDFEGTLRPLVNASVELYDDDTFGDEYLGRTITDWNGNWTFSVNNDDGFLANGRDLYYKFKLGNSRWDVHDNDGDTYDWHSAVHDDLHDGTVLDFGTETGDSDVTAMQVFGIANLGWNHIAGEGGQDPGYIEFKHPARSTKHSAGVVNVAAGDNDGPDSILHEYGHGLMYRAFGNTKISPGGSHGFDDDTQDPGLAYSEGWASGFMLTFCPDGQYNWHEGASEGAGEWPVGSVQADPGREIELFYNGVNRVGEKNEGRVAATINDFCDVANDDNAGQDDRGRDDEEDSNRGSRVSLASIYRDSMWGYLHKDFVEFWFTFAGNIDGDTRTRAGDIMRYNWMSVPFDISCVASKVVTAQRKDVESLLAGLRAFRDQALKPTAHGRRWIQTYYSNSPELAILLIRDEEARELAMGIIEHFARLGHSLRKRVEFERMVATNQLAIPESVDIRISALIKRLDEKASPELRHELAGLQEEVQALRQVTLHDLALRAERDGLGNNDKPYTPIRPRDYAPGSRSADWTLIRRYLPPAVGGEEGNPGKRPGTDSTTPKKK